MPEISFFVEDDGKSKAVRYEGNKTFKSFIEYYLNNNSGFNSTDTKYYSFMLGAKILNSPRFINLTIKDLIQEGAQITLLRKNQYNYNTNNK